MLLKTRGLILRSVKYGESSLILEVYTEERGIRSYIVSGVRKARSRFPASKLQLMNLVELIAYERPGKDLTRLKEVRPAMVYTRIPFEVARGAVGLFMLEVIRATVKENEGNPALFEFLYEAYRDLDEDRGGLPLFHHHFLLELTTYLGFLPAGGWSEETPLFDLREGRFTTLFPGHTAYLDEGRAKLMHELLHTERDLLPAMRVSRAERQGLLEDLLRYYRYHVEGMQEVNSLRILRTVMDG